MAKAWEDMTHKERLAECQTRKAEIDRVVLEVDVLCRLARQQVTSFMPIGLGPAFVKERDALERMLGDVQLRFTKSIRLAQKQGWAAR